MACSRDVIVGLVAVAVLTGCTGVESRRPVSPPAKLPVDVESVRLPYAGVVVPKKVGRTLYFSGSRTPGEADSVISFDLDTKKAEVIFEAPDVIGSVDANNEWLLWESDLKLYAQSLITGERKVIASSRDLYAPALKGDLCAWIDLTPQRKHQVVVHNLATGKTDVVAPIAFPGLYNNFMAWNDEGLVWTDIVGDRGIYRVFDVGDRSLSDYELEGTEFRYSGYPTPAGDRIYSINFKRTDEWDWTEQQLGYYSLSAKEWVPVVPDGFIANHVSVWRGMLAVIDDDMRLTVRKADDMSPDAEGQSVIDSQVDSVISAEDGTLVVTKDGPNGQGVTVHLIRGK